MTQSRRKARLHAQNKLQLKRPQHALFELEFLFKGQSIYSFGAGLKMQRVLGLRFIAFGRGVNVVVRAKVSGVRP